MRYCVINIHNIKPKIHFRGWFIWKYCHFLLGDRGGREFFNISEKEYKKGGSSKIAKFSMMSFLNGPEY